MGLYAGIDLHGKNHVLIIINQMDEWVHKTRLSNNINLTLDVLQRFKNKLKAIAVESTYNWYWLVDGLRKNGYNVKLAHPAAFERYDGIKYTNDYSDAFYLAQLLRKGDLPEGNIMNIKRRQIRDLLRKRVMLVQERTKHKLSLQSLIARNSGRMIPMKKVEKMTKSDIDDLFKNEFLRMNATTNINMINNINKELGPIEKKLFSILKITKDFELIQTVNGIGKILAATIILETGDINRFNQVGNYSSYCRLVKSERRSNGRKKGRNNQKNGNKYLCWAYIEAATSMIQFNEKAKKFYHRKESKTNKIVAKKALANKIARACFYILRDKVEFDDKKLFGA